MMAIDSSLLTSDPSMMASGSSILTRDSSILPGDPSILTSDPSMFDPSIPTSDRSIISPTMMKIDRSMFDRSILTSDPSMKQIDSSITKIDSSFPTSQRRSEKERRTHPRGPTSHPSKHVSDIFPGDDRTPSPSPRRQTPADRPLPSTPAAAAAPPRGHLETDSFPRDPDDPSRDHRAEIRQDIRSVDRALEDLLRELDDGKRTLCRERDALLRECGW